MVRVLRTRWKLGEWSNEDLPAGMDLLTVFDDAAARTSLETSWRTRRNWYPELAALQPSLTSMPRDETTFRSFDNEDIADDAYLLGTQNLLIPPGVHQLFYLSITD
nr:uncharacterized protein CTRU02_08511 [Colletotrichum truncatum]KAF6789812.1 hypothetical protein CTRU02_08511 [Colletotrichum truncatum]